jgi:MFS family permease
MEQRPGIVPLRPLRLGDIFSGIFAAIRHNPAVVLGLSLLAILAATIIGTLIGMAFTGLFTNAMNPLFTDPDVANILSGTGITARSFGELFGATTGVGIGMLIATPILEGIISTSVSQSVIGHRLSVREVWERVRPRIGAVIGWTLLYVLGLAVASTLAGLAIAGLTWLAAQVSTGFAVAVALLLTLVLLAAVFWVVIKLIFVVQVIVIEKASIRQAIARSWELTRGQFWRILGIYLLTSLLVGFAASLVTMPLAAISGLFTLGVTGATAMGVGPIIASMLSSFISTSISSIFIALLVSLLYIDSRMRKEGLADSLALAASRQVGGATTLR